MFIGHYGIAFGAKALFPEAPLPALMLSTQLIDVVWSALVLAKVERVEIDPTATPTVPLRLSYMPYSHSLPSSIGLSIVMGLLAGVAYPDLSTGALWVIALVCFSHWLLDLIVHDHDMPLVGNRYHVGFGLWHYRVGAITLEMGVIVAGVAALAMFGTAVVWKVLSVAALMLVIQSVSFFTAPPSTPAKLATSMLFVFGLMMMAGWWIDV
ncbi:hypothetical protein [uncultured Tateyamaria sp.]|uniref:hypothetical protein n=1 Tax=uncultured Tateyamaria sp. TaxID=455651 RepID=UPI00262B84BD|nr:hypothetical protein [uncultured Tateyamaria sp.]